MPQDHLMKIAETIKILLQILSQYHPVKQRVRRLLLWMVRVT